MYNFIRQLKMNQVSGDLIRS
jgi:hypothetical protein